MVVKHILSDLADGFTFRSNMMGHLTRDDIFQVIPDEIMSSVEARG